MARIQAAAALIALAASSVAFGAAAESWDMPMAYSDGNFHTQNGKLFAEAVGVCTGGSLEITVHGGGSLFKGNEIKRAVQTGQAQIGERLLSAHQNENALFGVDSIPFVATSFDESDKLWKAAEPEISKLLEEQNLVYLYAVPWPPQGLYTKKEINSVKDLEGVKFRAYNAATAKMAELAKMLPVQVEAAELSQALATGVAESFISSGATGYDQKVWEHLSHFYDVQAWLPRNAVFVNKDSWDGLSDQERNCLKSSAMLAQVAGTTRSRELTDWYYAQLRANGMTVVPPSETFKAELSEMGATMAEEWVAQAGDQGKAILDAYKAE